MKIKLKGIIFLAAGTVYMMISEIIGYISGLRGHPVLNVSFMIPLGVAAFLYALSIAVELRTADEQLEKWDMITLIILSVFAYVLLVTVIKIYRDGINGGLVFQLYTIVYGVFLTTIAAIAARFTPTWSEIRKVISNILLGIYSFILAACFIQGFLLI